MTDLRDIIKLRQVHESQFAREQILFEGVIVARNGTTAVPGVYDHVWVQPHGVGEPVAVYNRTIKASRAGMGVQVGFAPLSTVLEILRDIIASSAGTVPTSGINMPAHAESHLVDGDDPLYVHENAFMPLLTYTLGLSGLLVSVWSYVYRSGTAIVFFPGQANVSLAAHEPAAGLARYVLVYLDKTTNTIMTTAGATIVDSPVYTPPSPAVPTNSVPSALVRVVGGQTVIAQSDIVPVRDFLGGGSGVGGVWPRAGKVNIDSTEYDTLSEALAAAIEENTVIRLGVGSFTLSEDTTIPETTTIIGSGIYSSYILLGDDVDLVALNNTFQNLTINVSGIGAITIGLNYCSLLDVGLGSSNVTMSGGAMFGGEAGDITFTDEARLYLPVINGTLVGSFGTDWAGHYINADGVIVPGGEPNAMLVKRATINYDSSSPIAIMTPPTDSIILRILVHVTEAFDATGVGIEVGISGDTDLYADTGEIDLSVLAKYSLEPLADETGEVIATFTPGSDGTQGVCKIYVYYATLE